MGKGRFAEALAGDMRLARLDRDLEREGLLPPSSGAVDLTQGYYKFSIAENPSGILPTAFKVLVIPDPVEQKTAGGIIKPDMITEREKFATQNATLIAVSPAAFTYDDAVKANPPKPGDRVVIAKFAGFDIKGKDGAEYRVIEDKDVCAVLV